MELIDKSVVVAEIERRILEDYNTGDREKDAVAKGAIMSLKYYIEDTLEVKEVDFEKEWKEYFKYRGDVATVNVKYLAKHFFELGLKAQKGE